jgi:cyclic-di-GMP-binding biofilm dispersal mediator protein
MNYTDQKILVIGASGALGSTFVKKFTSAGAVVMGTASTADSMSRIPSETAKVFELDLMKPSNILKFCDEFLAENNSIDGIVIASGVVGFGSAETNGYDEITRLAQINHAGPALLLSKLFPALKESGNAFILGITGVVVEQVFPGMSSYTSSKMAHSGYLQSLQKEWRRYKIQVTEARLPHTETGLATRAVFGTAPQMPVGLNPDQVVEIMLSAILEKKNLISSVEFS